MRSIVRTAFVPRTVPLEGRCTWMYLDVLGYVTTAIGLLIDTVEEARRLTWLRPDGTCATRAEVESEWRYVKSRTDLAKKGGGHFKKVTQLRLSDAEVDRLTYAKLDQMWGELKKWLPDLEDWNADAQLAILSMSWGLGPRFDLKRTKTGALMWPKFVAAAKARDFVTCAAECKMQGEGTIEKRNAMNKALFLAAATSTEPEALHA